MDPHETPFTEIRVGDSVRFLGRWHRVMEIEPYEHPTVPGFFAIMRWENGAGMSMDVHGTIEAIR